MIETDEYGPYQITCDYCDKKIEINTDEDWYRMIAELKERKWIIRRVGEAWKHFCDISCFNNFKKK